MGALAGLSMFLSSYASRVSPEKVCRDTCNWKGLHVSPFLPGLHLSGL